jgi:branched-chain amino acid transport system substrate-binding protein
VPYPRKRVSSDGAVTSPRKLGSKAKINDMFTDDGFIRADGLTEHSMYVVQVKKPSESKYPWDYYRVVQKMSGEQAFGKLADSTCPLVKK